MSSIIDIDRLAPGMITAEAVQSGGRTIIGAETELTEKMISVFKAWGVTSVRIKGNFDTGDDDDFATISPEILNDLKKQITSRIIPATQGSPAQFDEVKRVMLKTKVQQHLDNS